MSQSWQPGSIYHVRHQHKGGYAVVRDTDQYFVDGTMFHRKCDAVTLANNQIPEKKGKHLIGIPKHRWNEIFAPGFR